MKRTLGLRFVISPLIIGFLRLLVSLVFWMVSMVAWTTGQPDLFLALKSFLNRWLWILAIISIILLILGIIFLATSKKKEKWFSIGEVIKFGRTKSKKHMGKFILGFAIYIIIETISSSFGRNPDTESVLPRVISIIVTLITMWLGLWFRNLALHIVDDTKAKFSDVFVGYKKTVRYISAKIIWGFIILVGFFLLIIPGIFRALKLSFIPYLILEKNLGPIKAIKESRKMTKGWTGEILVVGILCWLINILGFIAIFVWLLWTVPLILIANAYLYRKISLAQKA